MDYIYFSAIMFMHIFYLNKTMSMQYVYLVARFISMHSVYSFRLSDYVSKHFFFLTTSIFPCTS